MLNGISMDFKPGSFYFLVGKSGAGKSSLLNIISLFQRPTSGEMQLFGERISDLPRDRLPFFKRRIGKVFQDYRLLEHLSVEENVGLPLKVAGEPLHLIKQKVDEILEWIGLHEYRHELPQVLSGGQKQRVAIARAVITRPDVLLADEPTGNLDPALALKFMYLFETLNKDGATIIFATHDENLISRFSHHPVLRLHEGKLSERREPYAPESDDMEGAASSTPSASQSSSGRNQSVRNMSRAANDLLVSS